MVADGRVALCGVQQVDHRSALVEEEPEVGVGLGCMLPGVHQGREGLRTSPLGFERQGGEQADLDEAAGPPGRLRGSP